jgi:hypothetical protein
MNVNTTTHKSFTAEGPSCTSSTFVLVLDVAITSIIDHVGKWHWNNSDCYTGQYTMANALEKIAFTLATVTCTVACGMWVDGVMNGPGRYYYASGQSVL